MIKDKGAEIIMQRLGLISQMVNETDKLFEAETKREWKLEAQRRLRMLRRADGSQSKLGQALMRPRSIDPNLQFRSKPPYGGKLQMSRWVNQATKGAFDLTSQARERIYRRWPEAFGVWRRL